MSSKSRHSPATPEVDSLSVSQSSLWQCRVCSTESNKRADISQHIVDAQDEAHTNARGLIITRRDDAADRAHCGICSYTSSITGIHAHVRDKSDSQHRGITPAPIETDDPDCVMAADELMETREGWSCGICNAFSANREDVVGQQCLENLSAAQSAIEEIANTAMPEPAQGDPPDRIAHTLVTREEQPVRIHLKEKEVTVPTEPCLEGSPPTDTVPCASFKAVVDFAEIEDAGQTLWVRLHLPESEWQRIGLQKHWEKDDAETHGAQRYMEIWGSRFPNEDDYEDHAFTPPVPDDSPVVTVPEESEYAPDDAPFAPLDTPTLEVDAVTADSVRDYGNAWTRVDVGEIATVEPLSSLSEWPEEIDYEPRNVDWSPPSRHPDIAYADVDPIQPTEDLLDAVFTINRHAKRLNEEADKAYQQQQGAEARVYSIQKKALYQTKTIALHRMVKAAPSAVDVEKHNLGGRSDFWCFYFDTDHSFHQPPDTVGEEVLTAVLDGPPEDVEPTSLDFDASSDTSDLPYSLNHALGILAEHGIDANDQLDATTVEDYDWGSLLSTKFDIPE